MNRIKLTGALVLGVALAVSAHLSRAQDWPQWRGANRDAHAAGFTAPKTWPKGLVQKWKVTVGTGDATPALADGKLYVFARQETDEINRCLDAGSGKEVWQEKYPAPEIKGADASHGGPRGSPTVANGKVFTVGVVGTLSCLDAKSGKPLWRKDDFPGLWPQFHTSMSPLVVAGLCIVQLGKGNEGAVVAYDIASGEQKWKWANEGPDYASPMLMDAGGTKMVVAETAKSLVGLSVADGKLLWQVPFAPGGRMAYNAATPVLDGQTIICSGQGRGTRAIKIEKKGDAFEPKELWTNTENAVQFNSPVLKNGLLFGLTGRDNWFCLSAADGQTKWTAPSGGRRGFGSIVDAGSVLLALTPNSQLFVFEPSDKEFKKLAEYKVAESDTYAYPVASGNRLYVKDQASVILWSLEGGS